MKKCEFCDARMDNNDYYCPSCGKTSTPGNPEVRKNGFFHRIFSFFIPSLGIVLFILNRKRNKRLAKISIKSAIAGTVFYFLVLALFVLFYFYILINILT